MLFSPSHTLEIVLECIRQHPEHAEGIILGTLAAINAYDAMIGHGMREAEQQARTEEHAPTQPADKPIRPAVLSRRSG
jgi:hypothetical protein